METLQADQNQRREADAPGDPGSHEPNHRPTGNNGAVIFSAPVGPEGLEIKVENDWFTRNGCIKVTVHDTSGGSCMTMYFSPNTFERDFSAEEFDKKEAAADARKKWVQEVGREQAHKLVDLYWGNW